jgi:hypothetical protein
MARLSPAVMHPYSRIYSSWWHRGENTSPNARRLGIGHLPTSDTYGKVEQNLLEKNRVWGKALTFLRYCPFHVVWSQSSILQSDKS